MKHQPPAHFFHPESFDPIAPRRRERLTFGRKWNTEVLARLEAKQFLAEVVRSHHGRKDHVRPVESRFGISIECICGNIWTPAAIDPISRRCPVIVGAEDICKAAGCTLPEINAVWHGFGWASGA